MKLYVVNRLFNDSSADMTPTCVGIFTSQVCAEKAVRGMVFVESLENEKKDDLILRNEEYTMIRYITLEDVTITYTIEEVNA